MTSMVYLEQSGGEQCGGYNYFNWFADVGIRERGSASIVVIQDKCCGDVKNEEKIGGSVKIEENVVGTARNEARVGGTFNSQEMIRSCVMTEEVVAEMKKKINDLEICINSL
ncbi:hypothetical protein DEO72_LG6g1749 [Vigna unguiculata]|uniref:Uncharacterized protein n=1 Tax=Vigna unguiculata TaxID=3917 RepID=A0A4D6M6M9_VIGUN|nr:hypothetical protein DEO72_LG6g1749 [Vigna unguiculata]